MTFYEAALRVLEAEGRPLHFSDITEKAIQQNLLSHVGKTPEQTMLSRLAAMARRTRDRKVIVTAKDTFALVDWQLPEDAEALAQTGVPEPNPEEDLPPLRPAERHPDPRNDNVRGAGRMEREKDRDRDRDRGGRRRREEEEEGRGKRRRFPPIPEVAFEILSEAGGGLRADQLASTAKDRGLAGDDLGTEQILTSLLEDNQRRIDAGRRPQFSLQKDTGQIVLERAGAPSDVPPHELQAAFAEALNIPMEGGRPVLPRSAQAAGGEEAAPEPAGNQAAKLAVKDARKAVARALRRKLSELEPGTFEKAVVKMLHGVGFRELKVAKRSKDGPLLTARKREGSVELRFAVRMLKGSPQIDRRMVQDLRKDLQHYSAQVGLLASAGDVRGDARTEAQASGALVMLWCGDALGEKFVEAKAGVSAVQVELFELDDRFFEAARIDGEEAARRREERHREKQQREADVPAREGGGGDDQAPLGEEGAGGPVPSAAGGLAPPQDFQDQEGGEGEGDEEEGDEGDESMEMGAPQGGAPREGAPQGGPEGQQAPGGGERKRRRRRRRGRRGRGNRPEGAPGQPGQPGQPAQGGQPGQGGPVAPAVHGSEGGHATSDAAPRPEPAREAPPPPPAPGGEPGQG